MTDVIPVKRRDATSLGEFGNGEQIPAKHLVLPKGYIDGLNLVWNSGTSISVTSGSAYIESLGAIVNVPSTLTLSGLSLTASTWYHVYLYLNAGTPAIECVTTSPASAYSGTARSKSVDAARRYLGSVLTDSAGSLWQFTFVAGRLLWLVLPAAYPSTGEFRCLGGGISTAETAFSVSAVVPLTALLVYVRLTNTDAASGPPVRFDIPGRGGDYGIFSVDGSQSVFADSPCTSDQQMSYRYYSSPSSGSAYCDVQGFTIGR